MIPESYAGGSITTGRISRDRKVKGDDLDKKGIPRPSRLGGWGVGLTVSPHIKVLFRKFMTSLGSKKGNIMRRQLWKRQMGRELRNIECSDHYISIERSYVTMQQYKMN